MIKMEMKYFNTYYFCSIADYVITGGDLDFAVVLDEFVNMVSGEQREDFPKQSYLHAFAEFLVERIFSEQNRYFVTDIVEVIKMDGFEKTINNNSIFYQSGLVRDELYKYTMFEQAVIKYTGNDEKIKDWLLTQYKGDYEDELRIAAEYTSYLEDKYWNVIESIDKEVVYLLFQNRNFLMHFNNFMSDTVYGKSTRKNIPKWVQRAVFFRDRGRCAICNTNLSGLIDIEENCQKHFDHIVPLEEGGINDVSNIQLLCKDCNFKKHTDTYTSDIYSFWYDDEVE